MAEYSNRTACGKPAPVAIISMVARRYWQQDLGRQALAGAGLAMANVTASVINRDAKVSMRIATWPGRPLRRDAAAHRTYKVDVRAREVAPVKSGASRLSISYLNPRLRSGRERSF